MLSHAHCRFIMVRPSHPGNVGAAARAIKTMCFSDLVIVAPKVSNIQTHPDAIAMASGANDVLQCIHIVPDLNTALNGVTMSFALTARLRELGPETLNARQTALLAQHHLSQGNNRIAFVLGTERTGLENQEIEQCHRICHIPANPNYSSLNVAQALQLLAWEMHYALLANREPSKMSKPLTATPNYATQEQVHAFLQHWQEALIAIDFLNPQWPKKLMPRMRQLFTRVQLHQEEVDMLRGVCTNILKMTQTSKKK